MFIKLDTKITYDCQVTIFIIPRGEIEYETLQDMGHCVDKIYRQNQNMLTYPNQAQQIVSVIPFQWRRSFGMVF